MSKRSKSGNSSSEKYVDGVAIKGRKEHQRGGKKTAKKAPPAEVVLRGWCWTEMGPIFDLWIPSNNEEPYAQILKSRIWDAVGIIEHRKSANRTEWMAAKAQIARCRKYVLTLAEKGRKHHYDWAVWKAIGEIESDEVFAVWLTRHMEYGWS